LLREKTSSRYFPDWVTRLSDSEVAMSVSNVQLQQENMLSPYLFTMRLPPELSMIFSQKSPYGRVSPKKTSSECFNNHPQPFFHSPSQHSGMPSMEGYIEYTRREYCKDVRCPIQVLLDREVEKSPKYEEIRAICASDCLHTTHEFHHWLTGKGYLVVRPKQQ
jgi:hypothetical protein